MYQRLTIPTPEGYQAEPEAALERLGRLERLEDRIDKLQEEYEKTLQALERLQGQGKEKTVTYRQLLTNKMTLKEVLFRMGLS